MRQAAESLRRAKFKFPGRQKIIASKNWCVTGAGVACDALGAAV